MTRRALMLVLAATLTALAPAARAGDARAADAKAKPAAQTVQVLYAGSLVALMEHAIGPAYEKASGDRFAGVAGGSQGLANQIKGKLRRADVFISASAKVNQSLMGAPNGDWLHWDVHFASSPLVIGFNPKSRFAQALHGKVLDVLTQPGLRLGRTDPRIDPKGALTEDMLRGVERIEHRPGFADKVLQAPTTQILPEETLIGRLQSGQLDAGFFYSTEAAEAKIPVIALPAEITPKAEYSVSILRDAPDPQAAERFVAFMLGADARAIMRRHGLDLSAPRLNGDAAAAPRVVLDRIPVP